MNGRFSTLRLRVLAVLLLAVLPSLVGVTYEAGQRRQERRGAAGAAPLGRAEGHRAAGGGGRPGGGPPGAGEGGAPPASPRAWGRPARRCACWPACRST